MRGLALEGGGARGSYQVGAYKALVELGIDFQVISGTSVGAINGAIIASGNLEKLETLWLTMKIEDLMNADEDTLSKLINFDLKMDAQSLRRLASDLMKKGRLDISPFKVILSDLVDEKKIRHSEIDFGIVTLSLTDIKPIELFVNDIPKGKLHDYIIASANLPIFKNKIIGDKKMLDGGFVDNLPIQMLLDRGCEEVIAVRLFSRGWLRRIDKEDQNKITYIIPSESLGKLFEVNSDRALYNIKMGYFDTMRTMRGLYGTKYYITNLADESAVLKKVIEISESSLNLIARILNVNKSAHRVIFEEFIPLIADLLKVDKSASYGQLVLNYYEFLAEQAGIDRFEIMDYYTFINKVNREYMHQIDAYEGIQSETVERIISALPNKSALLIPNKMKSELLTHIYFVVMQGLR